MKTLKLTRAESAAYAAGERCFWRAMKPQPETTRDGLPYWFIGGFRTRSGASNPLRCPYGTTGDRILMSDNNCGGIVEPITAITVEQRDGKWGWVVEVGA